MSKSLEFSIDRLSDPEISCYNNSDWSNAVESSSREYFDLYLDGEREFHVSGKDENGQEIHVNTNLSFNENGDFQYCATKSCVCDGTLSFLGNLKYNLLSAVCCAKTICKTIEPVINGDIIDYTIGNFIILTEECESPNKDRPWLTDRFIVALPLKTTKRR